MDELLERRGVQNELSKAGRRIEEESYSLERICGSVPKSDNVMSLPHAVIKNA